MTEADYPRLQQAIAAELGPHPTPAAIRTLADYLNELVDELEQRAQEVEREREEPDDHTPVWE